MALRIIEGVPGSGKTYYAVRHLAKSFYKKQKDGTYILDKPCTIITNIDNFQPDHISLQEEIKKAGSVDKFFDYDFQEKYKDGKDQIVYVIDEAQRLFRKGMVKNPEVFSYFEYHRHWGQDIYLVTQNARKLPFDITSLPEYIVKALPRVRSLLGEFKYHHLSEGQKIKGDSIKPDQGVFALYKSMDVAETEKISNPVMKTVALVLLGAITVGFISYKFFMGRLLPDQETPTSATPTNIEIAAQQNRTKTIIPVAAPPEPKEYEIFFPINTIIQNVNKKKSIFFVFKNYLYPYGAFPYPTFYKSNQWYVIIDESIFNLTFPDPETRPQNIFYREKEAKGV